MENKIKTPKHKVKITSLIKLDLSEDFKKKLTEILPEEIKEFKIIDLTRVDIPRISPKWFFEYCIDNVRGSIFYPLDLVNKIESEEIIIEILLSKLSKDETTKEI